MVRRTLFCALCFYIAGFAPLIEAELYIASLPQSIQLSNQQTTLSNSDIPHAVSYLMGISTHIDKTWRGVSRLDIFDRPRANLFINLYVPDGVSFTLNKYSAKYDVQSIGESETPSLEELNFALDRLFTESPLIVDFELDDKVLKIATHNTDILNNLPITLLQIQERLRQSTSIASALISDSCLEPSETPDAFFLGELQTLTDILRRLQNDHSLVDDSTPDSFSFSLTTLNGLVKAYGADSCQVKTAGEMLETFIPQFIDSLNKLYKGKLLAEVNVVGSLPGSLHDGKIRYRRSLQAETSDTNKTVIQGVVTPMSKDYAIVANIVFWFTLAFALAVLASSYFIWYMDPGRDSIIYRMTTQRMKID